MTGCASFKPVEFSFAENAGNNETATVIFHFSVQDDTIRGVRLYDFEGSLAPLPAKPPSGFVTTEQHITFPAGRSLELRVYLFSNYDRSGNRRRGIIKLPPLEAGRTYKLWYHVRTLYPNEKAAINDRLYGNELFVLTDASVNTLDYNVRTGLITKRLESMSARFKAIAVMEIPTIQEYIQSLRN